MAQLLLQAREVFNHTTNQRHIAFGEELINLLWVLWGRVRQMAVDMQAKDALIRELMERNMRLSPPDFQWMAQTAQQAESHLVAFDVGAQHAFAGEEQHVLQSATTSQQSGALAFAPDTAARVSSTGGEGGWAEWMAQMALQADESQPVASGAVGAQNAFVGEQMVRRPQPRMRRSHRTSAPKPKVFRKANGVGLDMSVVFKRGKAQPIGAQPSNTQPGGDMRPIATVPPASGPGVGGSVLDVGGSVAGPDGLSDLDFESILAGDELELSSAELDRLAAGLPL